MLGNVCSGTLPRCVQRHSQYPAVVQRRCWYNARWYNARWCNAGSCTVPGQAATARTFVAPRGVNPVRSGAQAASRATCAVWHHTWYLPPPSAVFVTHNNTDQGCLLSRLSAFLARMYCTAWAADPSAARSSPQQPRCKWHRVPHAFATAGTPRGALARTQSPKFLLGTLHSEASLDGVCGIHAVAASIGTATAA